MSEFKKVLVVDDAEDDQIMIEMNLKMLNIEVDRCYDPFMALARLEQRKYDAVIVDLHMPLMDGSSLIKKIQEKKHGVPIYAMSGFFRHDIQHLIDKEGINVDGFISKDGLQSNLKAVFNGKS